MASNSVFIVDLACLDNAKDVQCDDMGTSSVIMEDGSVTFHGKTWPLTHDSFRKYYVNKSSRDV